MSTRQFTDDLAETEHRLKAATWQLERLREWAQKLCGRAHTMIGGKPEGLSPMASCHSDDLIGLRAILAHIANNPDPPTPVRGDAWDHLLAVAKEAQIMLLGLSQNAPHVQNGYREQAFEVMDKIARAVAGVEPDEGARHAPEHETIEHLREISQPGSGWGYAEIVRSVLQERDALLEAVDVLLGSAIIKARAAIAAAKRDTP